MALPEQGPILPRMRYWHVMVSTKWSAPFGLKGTREQTLELGMKTAMRPKLHEIEAIVKRGIDATNVLVTPHLIDEIDEADYTYITKNGAVQVNKD